MNENEVVLLENEEATHIEVEENVLPDTPDEVAEPDEMSLLKEEINSLKAELERRQEFDRAQARMNSELLEFEEYFPDTDVRSIPKEIWEQVRNGASLAGTYALFLRKNGLAEKKIGDFNEKNRRMSAGSLMNGEGEKYYSPAEVKKMTPAQVKKHYDDIITSIRHWN